jgi:CBS domain-containing protein
MTTFAMEARRWGAGVRALALMDYLLRPHNALSSLAGWLVGGTGVGVFRSGRPPTARRRTAAGVDQRRCRDVMTDDVVVVGTGQSVRDAARIMRELNVGFVPVCQSDHTVLGAITDRDLAVRVVADDRCATATVQDVMSSDLVACHPDDPVTLAEERMRERQVNRILVVEDNGRLAGVISLADLTQLSDDRRVGQLASRISEREVRH